MLSGDVLLIMGDMNAKSGSDNTDREWAMVREGCGIINDNGEKFVNFCLNNNYVVGGTFLQHKEIHKLTWKSPDGRTVNQIDHVVINNKWRRSLKDVHTCRGAYAGSDHYLVVSRLKLCLRKAPIKHDRQRRYNIARLKHEDTQKAFVLEVKNQFQKLSTDELDHPPIEERWNQIKATYCTAAESALGYLLLLVVSLHQSNPLSDTFFCDIVVNHEIIKRAYLSQQRPLEEMLV